MADIKKSKWVNWNKEFKKSKMSETLELTYNLFLQGNNPGKIAAIREQKIDTIYLHINKLITMGLISIDDVIEKEKKEKIIETIENLGSIQSTIPIKEALPENYSYREIKAVLAHLSLPPERVNK